MGKTLTMVKEKEATSDCTAFLEVMGASPTNKVLDFLIENERASWSMNEISKISNVGYSTLKILLPQLLNNHLIFVDRQIGNIKLYKINKKNKIIKHIYKIYKEIEKKTLREFVSS